MPRAKKSAKKAVKKTAKPKAPGKAKAKKKGPAAPLLARGRPSRVEAVIERVSARLFDSLNKIEYVIGKVADAIASPGTPAELKDFAEAAGVVGAEEGTGLIEQPELQPAGSENGVGA